MSSFACLQVYNYPTLAGVFQKYDAEDYITRVNTECWFYKLPPLPFLANSTAFSYPGMRECPKTQIRILFFSDSAARALRR